MSKSLAMEYMKRGVRINVVAPGGTDTPMNVDLEIPEDIDFKLMQRYTGMRGFSDPADIASAIAYLCSEEARSVHGAVWSVDNGMMAG
jgi:NAD(P)-dependent dehydrogenase (short-subunit alcohol dehydrogenase family)